LIVCPAAGPPVTGNGPRNLWTPGEVRVPRERAVLVRRVVLEELEARALAAAKLDDLLDHRARVHPHEVRHQVAHRVEERPELQRRDTADHVHEPVARLRDVRHGDPEVVDAEHAGHGGGCRRRRGVGRRARARGRGRAQREDSGGEDHDPCSAAAHRSLLVRCDDAIPRDAQRQDAADSRSTPRSVDRRMGAAAAPHEPGSVNDNGGRE
jgi:hypothetical protein